jgi:hypothetical protein
MAPGGVGAHENDQVGLVEVLVAARHHVLAEGAAVAGDGRGHAQPRIGVDVGRAEEALHQLVGDVIILGQQLAGQIEGNRVRSIALDHAAEAVGDRRQRGVPVDAGVAAVGAPQHRMEQAAIEAERLLQRKALRAQAPEVRRMIGIAGGDGAADAVRPRRYAAADAAIGAGGSRDGRQRDRCVHGSIHVRLIAPGLLQFGDEGDRLVGRACAMRGDDVD